MARTLASAFLGLAMAVLATVARPAVAAPDPLAARIVLLANGDDPDSLPLAQYYAQARGVPRENILAFSMPLRETISWPEFVAAIWQPLQEELVRRRWIELAPGAGRPPPARDGVGRRQYLFSGHRLAALVVCRGVPLRIDDNPALYDRPIPFGGKRVLRTNSGAVDSELSLLARSGGYDVSGFVPNPLFGRDEPTARELAGVVKVTRLDGPTAADARSLVDSALTAEKEGLIGRAYVTMGDPDPDGNRWLDRVAAQIAAIGFEAQVDRTLGAPPPGARADAPALYFGWHEPDLVGPFSLPGYRFPPGTIALHIHSYSARTLRSAAEGWCGPLVARGVAATMGNVYEPFLELTQRPDLLLRALARGDRLIDAAYYSLPVLSWQCVVIGDPLYRPFIVPLRAQLKNLNSLPPELAGYPVLRLMRLLDLAGKPGDATAAARAALNLRPGLLVLNLALARRLAAAGRLDEAAAAAAPVAGMKTFATDQWALAREAAQLLASSRHPERAVEIYRHLLGGDALPLALRAPWLLEAGKAALAASDPAQAAAWRREFDGLTAVKPAGAKP